MTSHRHLIFAVILTFASACGGGNPDDSDASTSDSSTNSDGSPTDAAAADALVSDAADEDASVEEDASVVEDSGPICPTDAGTGATSTAAATCMVLCGTYSTLCTLPTGENCQADCVAFPQTAGWTAARWGRMLDCVDITNANECAAAASCTALVSACP